MGGILLKNRINLNNMNRIITLLITLAFIFNCKSEKKKEKDQVSRAVKVSQSIILPNYILWGLNRLTLVKSELEDSEKPEFLLSRTSTLETAYASVNNIPVESGNYYRASIMVKKDDLGVGGFFGLRIIGDYPNRVDAVFDLENGLLKGVADVGEFFKGDAKIEDVGEGWYKCSLIAEVYSKKMKIILGPTSGFGKTITWEGTTKEKPSVYIIPSSLVLEELVIN
jgi:hypothetical protein